MTQKELIMKYIQDFGTITSYEAYTDLGITQLGARIKELEEAGAPVQFIRYGVDNG